jgi:hypothetical protein
LCDVFTFAVRCFLNPCYGNRDEQAFKRPLHADIMCLTPGCEKTNGGGRDEISWRSVKKS